jgi:amidase
MLFSLRLLPVIACLLASPLHAQTATGTWLLTIDRWGNPEYRTATLDRSGDEVNGHFGSWPLTGRWDNGQLRFTASDGHDDRYRFEGRVRGEALEGRIDAPDTNDRQARVWHEVHGRLLPGLPAGNTHVFEPERYSNEFSAHREPVLVIRPGDRVSTSTIDSGGVDRNGKTRALYGNPQTGPFFVAGAQPGDVLAVRIRRLRLNRDYADSLDGFVGRAMTPGMAANSAKLGARLRWRLDRADGTARLEIPPDGLKDYVVPVRPMLGGVGVAPDFGFAPASAGDTGRFGGNMDYNGIVEGATVYLPVFQPGALLYLGDGHALQGDGETTQWALETSLDVEFSVELLPAQALMTPRVESTDAMTTIGQAGSLDEAVRLATAGMVQWLEQAYGLDAAESSLVIGTAAEYRVATLAGRNAGMALSLPKKHLRPLQRRQTD